MVIENTEDLIVEDPETSDEGSGKKSHEMKKHSFDNAFGQMQAPNSLKYVVEAGDNPLDLLMRTIIPDRKSDSYRTVIAFATAMRKCREAEDKDGLAELRDILAMLPSMGGKSREQLVSSLIGYATDTNNNDDGIGGKVKKQIGRAFNQ